MSYLYDKLKDALGGDKVMVSKSTVIRDWSPNNIKVLIISKDYILVGHHLGTFGSFKSTLLDYNLVAQDVEELSRTNYGKPKLNSLLSRRSLSCLEEIYIDSAFMNYPQVIDLLGYVRDLIGTTCRLRYYGYGVFPRGTDDWVRQEYSSNSRNMGYALALDETKPFSVEYREVMKYKEPNGVDWYHNYYLRPQYYKMDSDNGKLAIHFRKFENDYEAYLKKSDVESSTNTIKEAVSVLVSNDMGNIECLRKIDSLLECLVKGQKDSVKKIVLDRVRSIIPKSRVVKGLNKSILSEIGEITGTEEGNYLLKSYGRYNILDTDSGNSLDSNDILSRLKLGKGFLDLDSILDELCLESAKTLIKTGYGDLVKMSFMMSDSEIPSGEFRSYFVKSDVNGNTLGYFVFLSELLGVEL